MYTEINEDYLTVTFWIRDYNHIYIVIKCSIHHVYNFGSRCFLFYSPMAGM